jgi:hypothetical protein
MDYKDYYGISGVPPDPADLGVREVDTSGSIGLISSEPDPPYDRPRHDEAHRDDGGIAMVEVAARAACQPEVGQEEWTPTQPVFTIGHSTRLLEQFIDLLQVHGVTLVADVPTVPRSRHNPQFNRDTLPESLVAAGIGYRHLAHRLPAPCSAGVRAGAFPTQMFREAILTKQEAKRCL